MSKYIVTQYNETIRSIAIKKYGTPTKEYLIVQANPNLQSISIASSNLFLTRGTVLTIPEEVKKAPKKIKITPKPKPVNVPKKKEIIENEEVSLVINGSVFKFWESADITLPFDSMRTFSLSCPFDSDNVAWRKLFKPNTYQDCILYVGGIKILTGHVIKISSSSEASSSKLNIEGYSLPGVLNDCPASASSFPLSFNGLNLKQISEKLCKPFGIKVIFDECEPGASFKGSDKLELDPEKKILEFIIDIAKQRNLVVGDDADGNLVFRKSTSLKAEFSLIDRKYPVASCGFSFDGQKRYSEITVISTDKEKGKGGKYTIVDKELKNNGIYRPITIKLDDIETGGVKEAAQSQWGRIFADSVSGSINLVGWRTPQKELLTPNKRFMFKSDDNFFYKETELLIRSVKLNKNASSVTSSIDVVFPDAYTKKQIEVLPWA